MVLPGRRCCGSTVTMLQGAYIPAVSCAAISAQAGHLQIPPLQPNTCSCHPLQHEDLSHRSDPSDCICLAIDIYRVLLLYAEWERDIITRVVAHGAIRMEARSRSQPRSMAMSILRSRMLCVQLDVISRHVYVCPPPRPA